MKTVYVAGPYTHGDVAVNVRSAIEIGLVIIKAGLAPYIPHLSHFMHMHEPQQYECWMGVDMAWIEKCDALYRLPGYSPGADREVRHAKARQIPVFENFQDLIAWSR